MSLRVLLYLALAAALALVFYPAPTRAGEPEFKPRRYVVGLCRTYHRDRKAEYNESNTCVGVEHDVSPTLRLSNGVFEDSKDRSNSWHGVNWSPWQWDGRWRLGVTGVLFTNYGDHLLPAAMPTLMYEQRTWGANLLWVPGTVIIAQLKLGF